MCGMGFYKHRSDCYKASPHEVEKLLSQGYDLILLNKYQEYETFTMLKFIRKRNDGMYLLKASNQKHLILNYYQFAQHTWHNTSKDGWREVSMWGSIRFFNDI